MNWICNQNRVDGCLNDCGNNGLCIFGECYCGDKECITETISSCDDGFYLEEG